MSQASDRETLRHIGIAVGALIGLAVVLAIVAISVAGVVHP